MTLEDIQEFKRKIRESEEVNRTKSPKLEGLFDDDPKRRLGVGYSRTGRRDFRLELRVQSGSGMAFHEAQRIAEQASGEAHVVILQRLEIPPLKRLFLGSGHAKLGNKRRPLHIGLSIGPGDGGAGTLGCFIDVKGEGVSLLSAAHVLTRFSPETKKNAAVYQPGKPDVDRLVGSLKVATLCDWTVNSRSLTNEVDGAAATLDDQDNHEGNVLPEGYGCPEAGSAISEVIDPVELTLDAPVGKIGRASGYRDGVIGGVGLDGIPIYSTFLGNMVFADVVEIAWSPHDRHFSESGDSGSLVYLHGGLAAIGLVFAGGVIEENGKKRGVTYVCRLSKILDDFGAKLLR